MTCPVCGGKTRVADIVHTPENEVYRRVECRDCGHSFYTVEYEIENDKTLRDIWRKNHRNCKKRKCCLKD